MPAGEIILKCCIFLQNYPIPSALFCLFFKQSVGSRLFGRLQWTEGQSLRGACGTDLPCCRPYTVILDPNLETSVLYKYLSVDLTARLCWRMFQRERASRRYGHQMCGTFVENSTVSLWNPQDIFFSPIWKTKPICAVVETLLWLQKETVEVVYEPLAPCLKERLAVASWLAFFGTKRRAPMLSELQKYCPNSVFLAVCLEDECRSCSFFLWLCCGTDSSNSCRNKKCGV